MSHQEKLSTYLHNALTLVYAVDIETVHVICFDRKEACHLNTVPGEAVEFEPVPGLERFRPSPMQRARLFLVTKP